MHFTTKSKSQLSPAHSENSDQPIGADLAIKISAISLALLPPILGYAFVVFDITRGGSLRPIVFEISWLSLAFLIIAVSIVSGAPVLKEAERLSRAYLAVFAVFVGVEVYTSLIVAPSAKMANYFLGITTITILLGLAAAALKRRFGDKFTTLVAWALFLAMLLHAPSWVWLYLLENQNPDFDWKRQLPGYPGLRMYGYSVEAGIASGLGLYFLSKDHDKKMRIGVTAGITLLWALLFWGGGRGAYTALFATIILAALVIPTFAKKMLLFCVTTIPAGAGLSLLLPNPNTDYGLVRGLNRTLNSKTIDEISTNRITVWSDAYEIFLQRPFFGHGAAQYPRLTIYPDLAALEQTHNIVLESLISFGAVGTIVLIFLLGKIWLMALLRLRKYPSAATTPMFLIATSLLTHGLFSGTFYHIHSMFIIALSLGLLLHIENNSRPSG